jgi:hypothetical protein
MDSLAAQRPASALDPSFRCLGFALAPAVVTGPRLASLRTEAEQLVARFTRDGHRSPDYWSFTSASHGLDVLYRIHRVQEQPGAALAAGLFSAGPLHDLAARVLGGPVRATVCAMIVKVPWHAAPVPWHRDRVGVGPGTVCNLSLFLDDCDADNGCLQFVPGSHRLADDADVQAVQLTGPVCDLPARAGDVAVHDVRTAHASRANGCERPRRSIVVEFAPVGLGLESS